jgi:hypothetical protein
MSNQPGGIKVAFLSSGTPVSQRFCAASLVIVRKAATGGASGGTLSLLSQPGAYKTSRATLAASAIRLRVRHLLFVPFLGALVLLRDEPRIVEQDAACALGGPAAGALFAMVCAFVAVQTGNRLAGWTAAAGALVNLLNLVPLSPLDGGRVLAVLSPRLSFIGVPLWGFLLYRHWTPDMLLVAVVALRPLFWALRGDQADRETIAFYAAPGRVQACALAAYLTTVAVLGLAFLMTRHL